MKPMCEANCGNRTQVYGAMYCPECHDKYTSMYFGLQFRPAAQIPHYEAGADAEYLLLNPCDGFHIAYGNFDDEARKFERFSNFERGHTYGPDSFIAWAKLPDAVEDLHPVFKDC